MVVEPGKYIVSYSDWDSIELYRDTTIKYIYGYYYRLTTHSTPNYQGESSGGLWLIYYDMLRNGFNAGPYNLIPFNEFPLANNLNRLYDNRGLWIYG